MTFQCSHPGTQVAGKYQLKDTFDLFNRHAGQIHTTTATAAYIALHEGLDGMVRCSDIALTVHADICIIYIHIYRTPMYI